MANGTCLADIKRKQIIKDKGFRKSNENFK